VKDFPIHVDFLRVGAGTKLTVDVHVAFENEAASPGLKRGGVLNIVRHTVELSCPADAIPDHITVDLTGRNIGDSIHISSVALPEGVTPTVDRDFTIATIVAPSGLRAEEAEATPAAEAAAPEAKKE
jgi:large subunit ribosomal protein L25